MTNMVRRYVSYLRIYISVTLHDSHVKQQTHSCYWCSWKSWFCRATCRESSSRARSSSQSAGQHRLDERSQVLSDMGAELVVADLTNGVDVVRALRGCKRMYFGMSISSPYLHATAITAAAVKKIPDFEILVNISQMTVSHMSLTEMTESPQQEQHWLGEQVLNWSGVPLAHVRSTIFLEPFFSSIAASSIARDGTIRMPFGSARISPISASDVARVVYTILENPTVHKGKIYELTGPRSEDMNEITKEYAIALNRPVKYIDTPYDKWLKEELSPLNLPQYVFHHVSTMAKLHRRKSLRLVIF